MSKNNISSKNTKTYFAGYEDQEDGYRMINATEKELAAKITNIFGDDPEDLKDLQVFLSDGIPKKVKIEVKLELY